MDLKLAKEFWRCFDWLSFFSLFFGPDLLMDKGKVFSKQCVVLEGDCWIQLISDVGVFTPLRQNPGREWLCLCFEFNILTSSHLAYGQDYPTWVLALSVFLSSVNLIFSTRHSFYFCLLLERPNIQNLLYIRFIYTVLAPSHWQLANKPTWPILGVKHTLLIRHTAINSESGRQYSKFSDPSFPVFDLSFNHWLPPADVPLSNPPDTLLDCRTKSLLSHHHTTSGILHFHGKASRLH